MEPPERASVRMMEVCRSVLNPTSSLLVYIFAVTKPMMVLPFLWITKKQLCSKAFLLATKPTTVLCFLWMAKKIVSKVFRFATKPTTVLSFLWITKKCLKALPD
jgi:hypothetical protein